VIDIFLNGESKSIDETLNLAAVLIENDFNCSLIAVAVNSEFVARSNYEKFFLKSNDSVDVVAPVAGG
jgi:sulfur carrier protein